MHIGIRIFSTALLARTPPSLLHPASPLLRLVVTGVGREREMLASSDGFFLGANTATYFFIDVDLRPISVDANVRRRNESWLGFRRQSEEIRTFSNFDILPRHFVAKASNCENISKTALQVTKKKHYNPSEREGFLATLTFKADVETSSRVLTDTAVRSGWKHFIEVKKRKALVNFVDDISSYS